MVSPRGGVFEGEKYLREAETLLAQLEEQKAVVEEKVCSRFQLRHHYYVILQVIETEVEVVKIEEAPVQVLAAIPVEESDVEKAKQDLTVNVLRVMMVPPGVQTFSFTDHVVITWSTLVT